MSKQQGSILVVDDEKINVVVLSGYLKAEGYQTTTVSSGRAALDAVAQKNFDAILLDVMMPGIDGFGVLRQIRETYSQIDLPVIMVTALDNSEDVVKALELGANDYVRKPVDKSVMMARLQNHIAFKYAAIAQAESEKQYRDLFNNANVLVQSVRADGSFEYVNPTWHRVLGYDENDLKGLSLFDIIHPESQKHCEVLFQRILAGESLDHIEALFVSKSGRIVAIEGNANTVFENGQLISTRSIFRDVTDKRKAEDALEEKNRLLFAFQKIGWTALASMDLEDVVNTLLEQVVHAGVFRSLMVALVDEEAHQVKVIQGAFRASDGKVWNKREDIAGIVYDLDDKNVTAEVARTGQMVVVEGKDGRYDDRMEAPDAYYEQNVSYFLPVKQGERVLAVLATASDKKEKDETLRRIEIITPLLDQVAIALNQVGLHQNTMTQAKELATINEQLQQEVVERQESQMRLKLLHSISSARTSGVSIQEVIVNTVQQIYAYFPRYRVSYITYDKQHQMKVWHTEAPKDMPLLEHFSAHISDAPDYVQALFAREPIVIDDVSQDTRTLPLVDAFLQNGTQAILDVPLLHSQDEIGLLSFDAPEPNAWSVHESFTLMGVAEYLSLAIADAHSQDERQRAEEALQFQNTLLSTQQEVTLDGILVVNDVGEWVSYNRQFVEMWGIPGEVEQEKRSQVALDAVLDNLIDPDEFLNRVKYLYEHQNERSREEIVLRDGRVLDRYSAPMMGTAGQYYGRVWYYRDITEQKKSAAELQFQNALLQAQQEATIDGILVVDGNRKWVSYNQQFISMWGIPADVAAKKDSEEALQLVMKNLVDPDEFVDRVHYLYAHQNEKSRDEFELLDGRVFDRYSTPMFGPDGQYYGRVWYFRDVTGYKNIEEALRQSNDELEQRVVVRTAELQESEERFLQLAENIHEAFYVVSMPERKSLYMSPAFETIWGMSCNQIKGDPTAYLKTVFEEDLPKIEAAFEQEGRGISTQIEYRIVRADGDIRWIWDQAFPVRNEAGEVYRVVGIAEDITEQKMLTEQLFQAQKMDAVGKLAGGVAHDFNNLLTVINGYSKLGLRKLDEQDPLRDNLEEIHKAGERAQGLTSQLLAFSRKQMLQPQVLDVNMLVANLQKMLHRLIGEDIELSATMRAQNQIEADPVQLEQVLMNLVVNARDAMPTGGKLVIKTIDVVLDEASAQHCQVVAGAYVCLSVTDTGSGMDEETQSRIFEPFFTTKEQGKGTGLGLSTVYGIVTQSGGGLVVDSVLGHGSTFQVYLPSYQGASTGDSSDVIASEIVSGRGTVLVAEDEDIVRLLTVAVLKEAGYEVLDAQSGEEARVLFEDYEGQVDLLVTDIVMPQMSGKNLADQLCALHPQLKVLYVSGYTDDVIGNHGVLEPDVPFLQKPFMPEELSEKVREILEDHS